MTNKKNNVISVARALSTVAIVICHIVRFYEIIPGREAIAQIFNVGVYIFFLISGFLYGAEGKRISNIRNYMQFLLNRAGRVFLPMLIWLSISLAVMMYRGETIAVYDAIMSFLGLTGVNFVFRFIAINTLPTNGHLWFATVIALCYILTPVSQMLADKLLEVIEKSNYEP